LGPQSIKPVFAGKFTWQTTAFIVAAAYLIDIALYVLSHTAIRLRTDIEFSPLSSFSTWSHGLRTADIVQLFKVYFPVRSDCRTANCRRLVCRHVCLRPQWRSHRTSAAIPSRSTPMTKPRMWQSASTRERSAERRSGLRLAQDR
jgi:hypothetical protein